ncbi:AlpA family phage regulatory protein [Salmonella enterica]|nr:AlpA family phage regulatory protein [Salmonella enterica]EIJ0687255.1 AlpA family phage regulatory protein [Salmonella enterica]EIJ6078272.1 AlpA family phage regulatory protein [Salmonella enterica]EIJ6081879.1 AlpA family phage regulatory protein [Salmonella enterica]EIJ6090520.1 AlpA family phage regulatory protein [Salmonella enterica]
MTTLPSEVNDELVDMKFITKYSKLTDKWFYKLIKDGEFPKPIKLGRSSTGCMKTSLLSEAGRRAGLRALRYKR